MKTTLKLLGALLMLAAASASLHAQTPYSKNGAAEPNGKFEVFNVAGTVTVSAWDRPEFAVEGSLDPGVERVEVTSGGGVNTVRVVMKPADVRPRGANLNFRIPAGSSLEVHTTSAPITVQGITGPQRLFVVSGSSRVTGFGRALHVQAVSGRVEAQGSAPAADVRVTTVSGGVMIRESAGKFDVETTSGRVELLLGAVSEARVRAVSGSIALSTTQSADAGGRFDIRTTSGRVDLALGKVVEVGVRTISGSMQIAGQLAAGARLDASAVSGGVNVALAGGQGYRYDLSSHSGSLRTCFDGGVTARKQLSGQRAGGAAEVRVRTVSGSVELCDGRK
jgi:hypothetical protein